MILVRIILCSLLLAVVLSAEETEEKSLSESAGRDTREAERSSGEGGRRKNEQLKGRRKTNTRKHRLNRKENGGERKRSKAKNKGRSRGRLRVRTGARARSSSSGLNETCFSQAIFFMKLWKDTVANFKKQKSRMGKQNSTGSSKSGKKDLFSPVALRLVDIGGGNKTNMSCGGVYGNQGAAQLQNLTKTLFDCEIEVNKSCNTGNFPQPNTTLINLCNSLVTSFINETGTCVGKSFGSSKTNVSDACGCWLGPKLNSTAHSLKSCKTSSSASAITKQLNKCKTAFAKCRKYEDDAITAIMSCATTKAQQTATAASLSANNASLTAAKTKMSSLASASASSGKRRSRSTTVSCAEVITKSKTVISYATSFPSSSKISTIAKEISGASVTCTATEKTSLSTQITSMETAITLVTSALSAIQEQIQTITGSTASSSQLTTSTVSTSVTTTAPKRRGKRWI